VGLVTFLPRSQLVRRSLREARGWEGREGEGAPEAMLRYFVSPSSLGRDCFLLVHSPVCKPFLSHLPPSLKPQVRRVLSSVSKVQLPSYAAAGVAAAEARQLRAQARRTSEGHHEDGDLLGGAVFNMIFSGGS
jgi:hypothetical protein